MYFYLWSYCIHPTMYSFCISINIIIIIIIATKLPCSALGSVSDAPTTPTPLVIINPEEFYVNATEKLMCEFHKQTPFTEKLTRLNCATDNLCKLDSFGQITDVLESEDKVKIFTILINFIMKNQVTRIHLHGFEFFKHFYFKRIN